ncbi:hypothetical protein GGE65_000769 [Skermanella aerolata]
MQGARSQCDAQKAVIAGSDENDNVRVSFVLAPITFFLAADFPVGFQ